MIWHLARTFTRQELRSRVDRDAQIHLVYQPELGYYEFRITAGTHEGLRSVLYFLEIQIDRMLEELKSGR